MASCPDRGANETIGTVDCKELGAEPSLHSLSLKFIRDAHCMYGSLEESYAAGFLYTGTSETLAGRPNAARTDRQRKSSEGGSVIDSNMFVLVDGR